MSYLRTIELDHVAGDGKLVSISVLAEPSQDARLFLNFVSVRDFAYSAYVEAAAAIELANTLRASLEHDVDLQLRVEGRLGLRDSALIVCTDLSRYSSYYPVFNVNANHHALIAPYTTRLIHPAVCTASEAVELHNAIAEAYDTLYA